MNIEKPLRVHHFPWETNPSPYKKASPSRLSAADGSAHEDRTRPAGAAEGTSNI